MVSNYQYLAMLDSNSAFDSSNGADDVESTHEPTAPSAANAKKNNDVEDSPEAIVRVENRVITWVRVLVFLVL
jgi:hypothetical protein